MGECSVCGDRTNMPYTCNYCGRTHCKKHKLPEKHDCANVDQANTLGPELRREYQPDPSRPTSKLPDNRVWVAAAVVLVAILTVLLLL